MRGDAKHRGPQSLSAAMNTANRIARQLEARRGEGVPAPVTVRARASAEDKTCCLCGRDGHSASKCPWSAWEAGR